MRRAATIAALALCAALCADEGPSAMPFFFGIDEKVASMVTNGVSAFSLQLQPDVRSAYLSRGKVIEDRPVASILARGSIDLGEWGSPGVQSWDLSSLGNRRTDVHRRAFNETDLGVFWHYNYSFDEDWRLSSEVVKYWVMLPGYTAPYRERKTCATINEWRALQSLENPYVTPFYLLRRGFHPNDWLYVRAGLQRRFPLGGGFALTPQWYAENGNEWHFERRYGPRRNGGKYHSGMQASNFILELSWKATKNISFFVSAHQFDIVSADARRSVKAHSSPCMRRDLTVGTIGCRIKF